MENLQLLFGEEELLIKEVIEKIKNETVPKHLEAVNFITFDGKKVSEDEIINAAVTVPMFEGKKLVVVYDARFFESAKNLTKEAESDKGRLEDFFTNIPSYTILIFTCEKVDKRKKLYKVLQKYGIVREFKMLSLKEKATWIQKRAELYSKKIDFSVAYFIACHTHDLYQTDMELKKIGAFLKDKKITDKSQIREIFSKSLENSIFDLMDCIGIKKPAPAIEILNELLLQGEKGIVILYMISKHIMDLISVKLLEKEPYEEMKKLGLHPYVLKKSMEQAKNFSVEELKKALHLCLDMDLDIKKGKIDERSGIELLIAKMAK